MDIRFDALGHTVEFDCEARGTRNGFAHDATIIIDGMRMHTYTAYYLNRTWEAWRFQSACMGCVSDLINYRVADLKERYRSENGITRICGKKRTEEVKDIIDNDEMIILYREIKHILDTESF